MEILRDLYLSRLKRREGNHLIKVITGIRRCGKSYLLFKLFRKYLSGKGIPDDHVIEIEFDSWFFLSPLLFLVFFVLFVV